MISDKSVRGLFVGVLLAISTSISFAQDAQKTTDIETPTYEIFLTIESGGESVTIGTDPSVTDSVTVYSTGNLLLLGYEWLADTNCGTGSFPHGWNLLCNTLYTITFDVARGTDLVFQYMMCETSQQNPYDPDEQGFYCLTSNPGLHTGQDIYITLKSDGEWQIRADQQRTNEYEYLTSIFTDSLWIWPHDKAKFCGTDAGCLEDAAKTGYFLTPQIGDTTEYTLSASTFEVPGGSSPYQYDEVWTWNNKTVHFPTGSDLVVRGEFNAEGMTFEAVGSTWGGIDFESGSSGTLSNANIDGAGINIANAEVSIDHSVLSATSGNAISVTGSSADVDVSYTDISGYAEGITYTSTAFGHVWQSAINVSGTAIATSYYADPYIGAYPYNNGGTNELRGGWISVGGYYGSTIWGGSGSYDGNNYICDGASSYDAYEDYTSTVNLEGNYWPAAPPNNNSEGVNYADWKTTSGSRCPPGLGKGFRSLAGYTSIDGDARLLEASILMWEAAKSTGGPDASLFDRATSILKEVRAEYSGEPQAIAALVVLFRLARLEGTDRLRSYFEELAASPGPDQATAFGILVQAYRGSGDIESARAAAISLAKLYPDQWHAFYAGLSIFEMDLDSGHFSQAATGLNQLVPRTKDELQKLDAAWTELVRRSNGAIQRSPIPSLPLAGKGIADSSVLNEVSAYPNPFNPSTAVSFDLMVKSNVDVTVYDALGRDIALLARDTFEPGRHRVTWDATAVPSGVYFVVIQAGGMTKSLSITLLR